MGFRFRKSFKIAPGVKVNFNKKSTGVTFGGKGFHYTVNSKGKRTTSVGIPGTGLSYSTTSGCKSKKSKTKKAERSVETMSTSNKKWYMKTGYIILLLMLFFPVGIFLMWKYTGWNKYVKIVVSVVVSLFFIIGIASGDDEDATDSNSIVTETTTEKATVKEETTTKEEVTTVEETTTQEETTTREETTTKAASETTTQKQSVAEKETTTKLQPTTERETTTEKQITTERETTTQKPAGRTVYITPKGKRYHYDPDCGGKNSYAVSIDNVGGRTPCQKCAQ